MCPEFVDPNIRGSFGSDKDHGFICNGLLTATLFVSSSITIVLLSTVDLFSILLGSLSKRFDAEHLSLRSSCERHRINVFVCWLIGLAICIHFLLHLLCLDCCISNFS